MREFIEVDPSAFTEVSPLSIIFWIFVLALVVQLWYYLRYYVKLGQYKKKNSPTFSSPVSIVICAKNEEENLLQFLPSILEQDFPPYEVVVVNDCSVDNTEDVLKEFTKKYNHLKIVTIRENSNHNQGKKVAMMMGIKGATNEYLLFTDADCKPNSKNWLRNMMQHFGNNTTEIVLGYGGYEKTRGLLNKIIRFDAFMIALQYLSFSLAGKTYMGVGRNLAYKKSLFFKMKGFASHYYIPSGDDDLFVNEAATEINTRIEVDEESHTLSRVKRTFKEWMAQKRRHITTFKKYKTRSKSLLFSLGISQYLFYICLIILLIFQFEPVIIVSLLLFRWLIQLMVFTKPMKILAERDLMIVFPVLEILLLFVYPIIVLTGLFIKLLNELDK